MRLNVGGWADRVLYATLKRYVPITHQNQGPVNVTHVNLGKTYPQHLQSQISLRQSLGQPPETRRENRSPMAVPKIKKKKSTTTVYAPVQRSFPSKRNQLLNILSIYLYRYIDLHKYMYASSILPPPPQAHTPACTTQQTTPNLTSFHSFTMAMETTCHRNSASVPNPTFLGIPMHTHMALVDMQYISSIYIYNVPSMSILRNRYWFIICR